jgi:hypothetical protein
MEPYILKFHFNILMDAMLSSALEIIFQSIAIDALVCSPKSTFLPSPKNDKLPPPSRGQDKKLLWPATAAHYLANAS